MALTFAFDPSKGETPETVANRRKAADLITARLFSRAPANVGEGLNAIGQALVARKMESEADDAQRAGLASAPNIAALLMGQPSAAPVSQSASQPGLPSLPAPINTPPNKIYSNDEASPLDPPSGADRDAAIRTIVAESAGQPMQGQVGVASVIRNRAVNGGYGGDTASGVVRSPNQFEPWNTAEGRGRMAAISPASPSYRDAATALDAAYRGEDPTNGAVNFIAPKAQVALGRSMPSWAQSQGQDIGDHRFFGGRPASPVQVAQADTGTADDAIPAAAQPAQGALPTQEQVRGGPSTQVLMQAASNPWLNDSQRSIVNMMLKQRLEQDAQATDPLRQAQVKVAEARARKLTANGGEEGTEYGLNPVYGKDENGNDVLGVLGKDGTFKKVDTGGVKLSSGVEKIDLGTHYQLRDKRSGQIVGTEAKDLRGAEREKAVGDKQGNELAAAPGDIQAGQNAIDILDKIEKHPYIDRGTGFSSLANIIPGTGGYDFSNMVEQAKSGAFLTAIQQMRGLGSLSNSEGGTATAAVNRMNTATSKEAFLDAASDYRKVIDQGMKRSRARLANPSATNPLASPADPQASLKSKYGLD